MKRFILRHYDFIKKGAGGRPGEHLQSGVDGVLCETSLKLEVVGLCDVNLTYGLETVLTQGVAFDIGKTSVVNTKRDHRRQLFFIRWEMVELGVRLWTCGNDLHREDRHGNLLNTNPT